MRILKWTIGVLIVVGVTVGFFNTRLPHGPDSPSGLTATIELEDSGFGPGADYYTDVVILDSSGREIARWEDHDGQESREGVKNLIHSMRWIDERRLQFSTESGESVELSAP